MVFKGFWGKLPQPIIGLSPMDGITDATFRRVVVNHGKPDVIYTEFVNVEGLARGAVNMLDHLIYDKAERPVVAQIYGIETESFYKVALMACYLGFDGIDINMGCPANKVARRNSGAGLIRVPDQAQKIIRTVKKAVVDWSEGMTLEKADLRPKLIQALKKMRPRAAGRKKIPVSIKTRTGIDTIIAEDWVKVLLEEEPAVIAMHGRTLKQMYSGEANWEVLGRVAKIVRQTKTLFLGNGDVQNLQQAKDKCAQFGTDGVLVGRATCGNPWFFSGLVARERIEAGHVPTMEERFEVALEHSRLFEKSGSRHGFFAIRKHLAWYIAGFEGARELRIKLMQSNSSREVEAALRGFGNSVK
jgi:tRNA-dihydrouridine synthase B